VRASNFFDDPEAQKLGRALAGARIFQLVTARKTSLMTLSHGRRHELSRKEQAKRARRQTVGRPASSRTLHSALACLLLAGGTSVLYGRVTNFPFVIVDDWEYVARNPHVHQGLTWSTIKWAFSTSTAANWHPLTWISHALDCQIFALNAGGHHAVSMLIHALNVLVLFLVMRWLTSRLGPSLFVAALFACHPLNVESVAWVAERKNVLCTLFLILAIAAYGRYAQNPRWGRYLLVVVLFIFGLMAKPMVITLPFVLLLLDYWPLQRMPGSPPSPVGVPQKSYRMLLSEKIPLLLLSVASALITVKAQGYAVRRLYQISLSTRLENAFVAYSRYIWKMIWPERLAFAYPLPTSTIPAWQWLLSGAILASITTLVVIFRKHRYLPVGWFWFLGMLVPVIGLVQVGNAAMADRYAYQPLIGLFVIIAWGARDFAGVIRIDRKWEYVSAAVVVIVLSLVTFRQIGYWDSEYDLWSHSLELTGNVFANDALGAALMDPQAALSPDDLRQFDTQPKQLDEARRHLERAVAVRRELVQKNPKAYLPDMALALNNLANLAQMEGSIEEARVDYEEAVSVYTSLASQNLNPYPADWAITLDNLAHLEARNQQTEKAREHFAQSADIYRVLARQNPERYVPNLADELDGLAAAERDEKKMPEARRDYAEVLALRTRLAGPYRSLYLSSVATTLNDLGVLDGMDKKPSDSIQHFQAALAIYRELALHDPSSYAPYIAGTLANLARSCADDNRLQESRAYYMEALAAYQKLSQDDPGAYADNVAKVEAALEQSERAAKAK